MLGEQATDRTVFAVIGTDRVKFLQGLVTNNVEQSGLIYTALLSPQGKYLADFFLLLTADAILLDVKDSFADGLLQRLNMYKLRADVAISQSPLNVSLGLGTAPDGAFADPRSPEMGWRAYTEKTGAQPTINWDAIRVSECIPETGVELVENDSYILESCFEGLSGVDFKKGCYVGQEVTARMKHKTELRKGLATVAVKGSAPVGAEIQAGGKPVGRLFTQSGGFGIAYLRFDRAKGEMQAGDAIVELTN